LRYPVFGTIWPEPEPEADPKKRPDIRPTGTGTGYPVHPYLTLLVELQEEHLACKKYE